ncbi:putative holin-like toxin [Paenibacillus thailandensis]
MGRRDEEVNAMSVNEALTLMISFATLVVSILAFHGKK